jgi:very-short-patch-repair endonuclease
MLREPRQTSAARTLAAGRGWVGIAQLASRQHGVVALRQLVDLGAKPSTVRGWVATGLLVRMHHGVFAVGHDSLRREAHYIAAVLACGPGSVLSHRSGAAHIGVRASPPSFVEVSSPFAVGRGREGLRVHDGRRLLPDEIMELEGIPCTTLARTLIDLAAVVSERAIAAAVEASERLELFDLRSLSVLLGRHQGRRGTAKLRRVLAAFNAEVLRARTESEARLFHLCVDEGLPAPLVNRLVDAGPERFEVDCHWPHARLVVEVDSPYHDTTAAGVRDAARDAALRRHGWTVIRCRWADIVINPEPLLTKLRAHPLAATRR